MLGRGSVAPTHFILRLLLIGFSHRHGHSTLVEGRVAVRRR